MAGDDDLFILAGQDGSGSLYLGSNNTNSQMVVSSGNVGIATTSPYAKLSVAGQVVGEYFTATSSTATSTFYGGLNLANSVLENIGAAGTDFTNTGGLNLADRLQITSSATTTIGDSSGNKWDFGTQTLGGLDYPYLKPTAVNGSISGWGVIDHRVFLYSPTVGGLTEPTLAFLDEAGIQQAYIQYNNSSDKFFINGTAGVYINNTDLHINADSKKTIFGTGGDSSITYDGTNMVLNSQEVGSGDFVFNGGNIGIATTSPSHLLSVESSAPQFLLSDSTTAANSLLTKVDANKAYFQDIGATDGDLLTLDLANNRLGIGTANPGYSLQINQSSDNDGLRIYGYDDKSTVKAQQFISSLGIFSFNSDSSAVFTTSAGYMQFKPTTDIYFDVNAGEDINFRGDGNKIMLNIDEATGNVGIATTSPYAKLSVVGETVAEYFTATSTSATSTFGHHISIGSDSDYRINGAPVISINGSGGISVGSGNNTTISGTAVGLNNTSSGVSSAAVGNSNTAGSTLDTAIGYLNTANGALSSAIGYSNTASALNSIAIGYVTEATSTSATAIGNIVDAGAVNSVAIGSSVNAYALSSVAMGLGVTNNVANSLMIGVYNTAKMTILSTGYTGVNTTTPSSLLSIEHTAGNNAFAIGSSTASTLLVDASGNVGVGTANPDGKFKVQGAGYFAREENAFGTSNIYTTLVLDGGDTGALYAVGRANSSNEPFVALSGYDNGSTARALYYGGGVWDAPDATQHLFYTAPTYTETNNTGVLRMDIKPDGSIVVGSPTGGGKGAGTINAQAVYDDNTLLTDYVFDKYYDGQVLPEDEELHGDYTMLTLTEMEDFIKDNRHLPTITGRDEWRAQGGISLGKLATQLWETAETQALYLTELNYTIQEHENIINQLNISLVDATTTDTPPTTTTTIDGKVFTSLLIAEKGVVFGENTAGVVRILAGDDLARVTFSESYTYTPIITLTLLTEVNLDRYLVTEVSTEGFTVTMSPAYGSVDVDFNWLATLVTKPKLFLSDGSVQDYILEEGQIVQEEILVDNGTETGVEEVPPIEIVEDVNIESSETNMDSNVVEDVIGESSVEALEETVADGSDNNDLVENNASSEEVVEPQSEPTPDSVAIEIFQDESIEGDAVENVVDESVTLEENVVQ